MFESPGIMLNVSPADDHSQVASRIPLDMEAAYIDALGVPKNEMVHNSKRPIVFPYGVVDADSILSAEQGSSNWLVGAACRG